jgi:Leucine-rich repeat (LRR) protein
MDYINNALLDIITLIISKLDIISTRNFISAYQKYIYLINWKYILYLCKANDKFIDFEFNNISYENYNIIMSALPFRKYTGCHNMLKDIYEIKSIELDYNIPGIGNLINLTELSSRPDDINEIPEEIKILTNLRSIDFGRNELSKVEWDLFYNMKRLEKLKLQENDITSISYGINNLTSLKLLDLSNNLLTNIPKEINCLSNLTSLNLSYNKLEIIPDEIGDLINLKTLSLNNNKISMISRNIGKLINLKILYLNDNKIDIFPNEIYNLKLSIFHYYGNNCTCLNYNKFLKNK